MINKSKGKIRFKVGKNVFLFQQFHEKYYYYFLTKKNNFFSYIHTMLVPYTTRDVIIPDAIINDDRAFLNSIESDYWYNHGVTKVRKDFVKDLKTKTILTNPRAALQGYRNIIKTINLIASNENKDLFQLMKRASDLEIEEIKQKKSFENAKKVLDSLKKQVQKIYGKDFKEKVKAEAMKFNVIKDFP